MEKTLADILNQAAAAVASNGPSKVAVTDIVEPTEEDLLRLQNQTNLITSMTVTYNNWASRRADNRGQIFCTFELDPTSPVEGMTNKDIVDESLRDHKLHGCNIFIPAPDQSGILRDVRVIKYNEEGDTITAVDDAARPFKATGGTTKITRKQKSQISVEAGPAPLDKGEVFKSKV